MSPKSFLFREKLNYADTSISLPLLCELFINANHQRAVQDDLRISMSKSYLILQSTLNFPSTIISRWKLKFKNESIKGVSGL